MKRLLLCLLILCGIPVHAATWTKDTGWELKPSSDGVWQVLPGEPSANKPSGVTCVGGSCTASKPTPLPKVSPPTNFTPSSLFNKAALAVGLASRLGPWIGIATAAYNWLKDSGLTVDPSTGEVTEVPDAQAVSPSTVYQPTFNSCIEALGKFATRDAALAAASTAYVSGGCFMVNDSTYRWELQNPAVYNGGIVQGKICRVTISNGARDCNYSTSLALATFSNPQSNCYLVATGRLTGVNTLGGLCPAGTPVSVPSTAVAGKLTGPITDANLARVFREVLDNGGRIEDSAAPSLTGPTQVQGKTAISTTTTPSGTQAVTTTTTNYNISYNTNNISISEGKTITNPDGSTVSTLEKPTDPCATDPLSLACAKLGDPGTDAPQWQTKTITYQAENLGFTGSCPAPWTGTVHGWNLAMSWQPACDVAPQIRLGVLALCTLGALLMIVTTVRT